MFLCGTFYFKELTSEYIARLHVTTSQILDSLSVPCNLQIFYINSVAKTTNFCGAKMVLYNQYTEKFNAIKHWSMMVSKPSNAFVNISLFCCSRGIPSGMYVQLESCHCHLILQMCGVPGSPFFLLVSGI